MPTQHQTVAEHLRKLIAQAERQGESRRSIAERCGVHVGQLTRFMASERTPQLHTAERIADGLGYSLILKRRK